MLDAARIAAAYETAKATLLAERGQGHWVGELSTSALSTATAVSALALVRKANRHDSRNVQLSALIRGGVQYLMAHQNIDGGWGDTEKSYSNIATTMLAVAALHLAEEAATYSQPLAAAEQYIAAQGRLCALRRRYGTDKTFVVPILTNAALAGLVPWSEVDPLPFELACVPQSWYRFVGMPVVSYAIPALVAMGQARYFHAQPRNPLTRCVRALSVEPSLRVLRKMQPQSGGYLEAVPLTSFVVMSLAATGRAQHAVTQNGVQFLIDSVRPNGSWPIDTNLATWVTTLSLNALAAAGEDVAQQADLDWLLKCQYAQRHPFTGAAPGGWGWSNLTGAVPDGDDTPGAMLALCAWLNTPSCRPGDRAQIRQALQSGTRWLLDLQNRDGGWPTFCRGWGKLPFDRSGVDLTAHALRALLACRKVMEPSRFAAWSQGWEAAVAKGWHYLAEQQRADGSWLPLWFGNQDHPEEENPIYGTAKVLMAYRDAQREAHPAAIQGREFLLRSQNADGGWGGGAAVRNAGLRMEGQLVESSIEETALAVEALLAGSRGLAGGRGDKIGPATQRGVAWLCAAVENSRMFDCAPIGFYFAKLWYYERLYPLTFTVSALGQAVRAW
jgi:squalene-hopene/tetraprenyl-beta-curcumene cyclase